MTAQNSVIIPSRLPKSCGFVRFAEFGALEIELYDRGELAQRFMGDDVATIYTVGVDDLPALAAALNAGSVQTDGLPAALAAAFGDIDDLIQWLKDSGVAFSTKVNPWA